MILIRLVELPLTLSLVGLTVVDSLLNIPLLSPPASSQCRADGSPRGWTRSFALTTATTTSTFTDYNAAEVDATAVSTTTTKAPPNITPLKQYDAWINARLAVADQVSVDQALDVDSSSWQPARYSLADLQRMVQDDDDILAGKAQRQQLVHDLQAAGGCIVVELSTEQRRIMETMWDFQEYLFATTPVEELRHQTLTRDNDVVSHQYSGYAFVQTSIDHHHQQQHVKGLPNQVGTMGCNVVKDAYTMLSQLATTVAVAAISSANDFTISETTDLIHHLLNDEERRLTGSYHRLARYMPVKDEIQESLRSHGDWTLTTPIPIASIPGLQIWNPQHQNWLQVEAQALYPAATTATTAPPTGRWNTRYCVVMMGKWAELVTAGGLDSCIHRVVSRNDIDCRYSAPFFLRPRDSLFASVGTRFDNTSPDHSNLDDETAAATTIIQEEETRASIQAIRDFLISKSG